jgi:branched-chain amino acid transport system ATP-binding protein
VTEAPVDLREPGAAARGTLIEARGLSAGYGKMAVVHGIDIRVDAGEVVALIGANGAGKTTTLLTLAGELTPMEGEVRFLGDPTRAPMHARCRAGLGYVTEERSVIMDMTVADNLKLAAVAPDVAFGYFPDLERIMGRRAGLCSGGEQQMLSLARALGREPKVLLADELSLGLAPIIVANLLQAVRAAADERGVGVLLVEQHVRQALKVADRVYLMERGHIILSGTSAEIVGQLDRIEAAYLSGN